MPDPAKRRVLFVCMGNICRSPLAEGIFLHKAAQRGVRDLFDVDSAGTGDWHAGEAPHPHARAVAAANGVRLESRARQVTAADFARFAHLICMDESNRRHLARLGAPPEKLRLLLALHPRSKLSDVPDPYGDGPEGFERVYRLIEPACEALLDELLVAAP
jgi:low molecular weight protein-tyrosine phosphatase